MKGMILRISNGVLRTELNRLFLATFLLSAFTSGAMAQYFEVDGVGYTVTNYTECAVTMLSGAKYSGNIVVPESVVYESLTYPVTAVFNRAFSGSPELKSVVIPSSVKTIGQMAFSDCTGLTEVTLPNTLNSLDNAAFAGCSSLKSIEYPASLQTVGYYMFRGCSSLSSVVFRGPITEIGPSSFWGCTGLQSFDMPSSVTKISSFAFYECTGLTSFVVPSNVCFIESGAFGQCTGMKSFKIEDSGNVLQLGDYLLTGSGIERLYIGRNLDGWDRLCQLQSLSTVTLGPEVTAVGKDAFDGSESLVTLNVMNNFPPTCSDTPGFTDDQYANVCLYIPIGSWPVYINAPIWQKFLNMHERDFSGLYAVDAAQDDFEVNGRQIINPRRSTISVCDGSGRTLYLGNSPEIYLPDSGIYVIQTRGKSTKIFAK